MPSSQLHLFKDKRFLPIFIIQFCSCLNDNILKNALIILSTYKLSGKLSGNLGYSAELLAILINTLFVLPFIVFASLAGQLADKYERSTLVKIIKFCEIGIVMLATYGFLNNNLTTMLTAVWLMGVQSTFLGPIKYSVLPDQLNKQELLSANCFIIAGTFVAILIATIIGGFYNLNTDFVLKLSLVISIVGIIYSFFMPKSNNTNLDIKINFNLYTETVNMIKYTYYRRQVYLAILGISWFWFMGAIMLAQILLLSKVIFAANQHVANLFLAIFATGIAIGAFTCNKILNNDITPKYLCIAAFGLSLFGIDLFFASCISKVSNQREQMQSVWTLLSQQHNWRIVIDILCFAVTGGFYVVPLYAIIQYFTFFKRRGRVLATNNLINAIFMAVTGILLAVLLRFDYSLPLIILLVSLLNLVVVVYIYQLIPDNKAILFKVWAICFRFLFNKLYKVEVRGIKNFHKAGKRTVIVANHISYIDPALLAVYLPVNLIFAIDTTIAERFWVKPFLKIVKALPVDSTNPMAIKTLIDIVKQNKRIVIFPEGRISTTGSLMKVYQGPAMIADRADATILPVRIDGAQFSYFSKLKKTFKLKLFPKIVITILPPVKVDFKSSSIASDHRKRRHYIGEALYDIMCLMMFESSNYKQTIFSSVIEASKIHGPNKIITQDIDSKAVTYRELLFKTFTLADFVVKHAKNREYVGWMLPNMVASIAAFLAIVACGRIPVMINFTSGVANIIAACRTTKVKSIYTSRQLIAELKLEGVINKIAKRNINIIYLEDLQQQVSLKIILKAYIGSLVPETYYRYLSNNIKDLRPAVALFTAGTEGVPKAVVLSHRNIQANRFQVMARVDFSPHDIAFSALPMFNSFGFMSSILMLTSGIKTFFYPFPLHYRIIPETIYYIGATILFATDTFLANYGKYAHSYDFYSLRYVFAGAEKLKEQTRQLWLDKYGIRISEGYGVTAASPIIAANTPMHNKAGTVGRLMPKIEYVIKPVAGVSTGGRLYIKGPNVMMGYILPTRPKVIQNLADKELGAGWYDTGDIVKIDSEGYMTILSRAQRLAKIAGVMISLQVVEDLAYSIDAENLHAAILVQNNNNQEQLWLFTTGKVVTKEKWVHVVKDHGLTALYIPQNIVAVDYLPEITTGKIDYSKVKKLAAQSAFELKRI